MGHYEIERYITILKKLYSLWATRLLLGLLSDERQGTLRLSNLTKNMSGKYVCRASNTAGTESCHINLEVSTCKYHIGSITHTVLWIWMALNKPCFFLLAAANNAWVIAGAAVGSAVGLMALVLFLIFILKRNHDTEEEMSNDIK